MEVLRDPTGRLDLTDIRSTRTDEQFKPLPDFSGTNFGFTDDTIWLRFRLHVAPDSAGQFILEVPYAPLDRVVLHVPEAPGNQQVQYAGDRLPFARRTVEYRLPAFKLDLSPGQTVTAYLEISSAGAVQASAVLWRPSAFYAAARAQAFLLGPYYGVLAAMALYNLLVFACLWDRNYLYYVGSIVMIGLFAATLNGFAFQFLWPQTPAVSSVALPLFAALGILMLLQFSRSFLNLKRYVRHADRVLLALQILACLMVVGIFVLPYRIAALGTTVVVFTSSITILISALQSWWRGERQARYFILGWALFLIGTAALTLSLLGWLPATVLTRHGFQIGSAIEMILLAFALADRMLLLQRENEKIRMEATNRLLRDLHDGMGRHFVKLIRGVENNEVPRSHLRTDLRKAFADMRLLVSSTDPEFTDLTSGLATIREQFDGILRDHGISWNWQVSLDRPHLQHSPKVALNVLRIVQEALTNAVKYASASTITIRAFMDDARKLVIEVEDDGTPASDTGDDRPGGGHGLRHMQQRARDHGIELDTGDSLQGIRMRLPAGRGGSE